MIIVVMESVVLITTDGAFDDVRRLQLSVPGLAVPSDAVATPVLHRLLHMSRRVPRRLLDLAAVGPLIRHDPCPLVVHRLVCPALMNS